MKKNIAHSSLFLLVSLTAYLLVFFVYGDLKLSNLNYAGEEIPKNQYKNIEKIIVSNNKKVLKRLYIKSKSSEYLPIISQKLEESNLPEDLKYIPFVESSLNITAQSSDNSRGLWQISPDIAQQYGVIIAYENDDRYDIDISTTVALEYLNYLYNQQGSWIGATLAYNMGEDALNSLKQSTTEKNLFSSEVNEKSGNYILKALAYKYGK